MRRLPGPMYQIVLAELGWFALMGYLSQKSLAWFGVEFTDEGVRKRGLFETRFISWSEATIYRQGLITVIWSAKGTIKVNAAAYPSARGLNEYLATRTSSRTPQ
jgi:hypothetical protein